MNVDLKSKSIANRNRISRRPDAGSSLNKLEELWHLRESGNDAKQVPPLRSSQPRPGESLAMHFRVDLDVFRGPLDLLLYLVRKHELDVTTVSIASITDQFVTFLDVLTQMDVNLVGDFIEVASILIEVKSKTVLPSADDPEEMIEDSQEELVHQLLEYKKFKDAASILEDRGRDWQQRFTRISNDLPPREIAPADQPIHEVELWDLVNAFGGILRCHEKTQPCNIVLDEIPIAVFIKDIHTKLRVDGQIAFSDMFQPGMHKTNMIGVFLAVLELVRHHHVEADQPEPHGEIYLLAQEGFSEQIEIDDVDEYLNNSALQKNDFETAASAKPK